ncbi:MAG: ABC transporter ATP-binding protein [Pyrinomonadaceae bacterium]
MSLKVSNLSKLYGQKWVLRDVSLEAKQGEILGLFGASGSGKTTLLNILAGLDKSNGGSIHFDSNDVTGQSPEKRGFTFTRHFANSPFSLKSLFGSGEPTDPSGSSRTEAIRKAAKSSSKVLLIDEGFSSVDSGQKLESIDLMRRAAKEQNLAIVFATSNFEDILVLCDRVAVIADTEIKQTGTPQEVYLEPQSYSVARITGRNNLFSARRVTSSKADTPQFQTIDGSHRLAIQKIEKRSLGALNQNVSLGIRPDHISISFGASFPEDNLIKATITKVQFLGATTLVELDANGLRLDALVLRLVGLNAGDECMLGLPPDRIAIYKE